MKVRSLFIVDLSEIIKRVEKGIVDFMVETKIDVVNDLTNLFISRVFLEMSEVYKEQHEAFVVFYLDSEIKEHLLDCEGVILYKRFFRIMEKEVKFPSVIGNLKYELFANMMKTECPEYDEVVANHKSFAELFPKLKVVIERLKFYRLKGEVVDDIKNKCKMMLSL